MQRTVEKIEVKIPAVKKAKRVAAYARVSSGKDAMLHSLSAQVSYYSNYIQSHKGWEYCGVYSDEAKTGTKDSRCGFQELLSQCKAGKIDMIITKSISRFARNTVTLLETVRELKNLGIDVYFEEQNIHSLSTDGELMLTILASYAQEESRSASENQKWRMRKDFERGFLPMCFDRVYGYRRTADGGFEPVPEEAETVREIFQLYLSGFGIMKIAKQLNEKGILTETGKPWREKKVRYLLSNERYVGDLLLQKNYISDHLTKRKRKNSGQLPQYYVKENHAGIISRDIFQAVQMEMQRRAEKYFKKSEQPSYPFTGMLVCGICGKHYRRKTTAVRITWICGTYNSVGKSACASKQIPETTLVSAVNEVLEIPVFDEETFKNKVSKITVCKGNILTFHLVDGAEKTYVWKDRSRSESWTDEMREKARQKAMEKRGVSRWREQ